MARVFPTTIDLPGIDEPISLILGPDLAALRQTALDRQMVDEGPHWRPTAPMAAAEVAAWQAGGQELDRHQWCAQRFAIRLAHVPICLEPGEPIVGKPFVPYYTEESQAEIDALFASAPDLPRCPGGDAGHFHPNYDTVFALGVGGLQDKIAASRAAADESTHAFYDACATAMDAFQAYIRRVAETCRTRAAEQADEADYWLARAATCDAIATDPPATFHQACQLMYFVFIASWVGEDHVMTCLGRLDRTLHRFYQADIAAGRITPQRAMELIAAMFIQINRICAIGIADAVMVSGRDEAGNDTTNELTYLTLAARLATRLRNPSVGIAWHSSTPDELMTFAMEMLATGIGCPAFFNDELIAASLIDHGVSPADSVNYMNSTCVEIKPAGTSHIWVATEYVNCPKALLDIMAAEAVGEATPAANLGELEARLRERIASQVAATARLLDDLWARRAATWAMPFASCIVDDCLDVGRDHDNGGCRYQWAENSFVGLSNLADSLVAIDDLVYQTGELTLAEFYAICERDFDGAEALRQRIVNDLPSYGNDDDRVDAIASRWATFFCDITDGERVAGHRYVPGFFTSQFHAWLGYDTPATPDGRLACTALANGAGAYQGREHAGPTASALSTTKWSHGPTLGGLVHNVRFSERVFADPAGRQGARAVVETYLQRGGFEIQLNVVSADTLRAAKANPEAHRDLLVRVAGYTNYFTSLLPALQDDVIARTEFGV